MTPVGPGLRPAAAVLVAAGLLGAVAGCSRRPPSPAPPVHEVATDWRDPLAPTPALLRLRGPDAWPIEAAPAVPEGPRGGFLGRLVAEVNARTCPAARPALSRSDVGAAYARLRGAVRAEGWTVVTDAPAEGRLEATRPDGAADLMARVRPGPAGEARTDLRSSSLRGVTDDGSNCRRIAALRGRLSAVG